MKATGSTLVLLAVLLSMILVILLGGLELGLLLTRRTQLQRATDAGALAGASGLLDGDPGGDSVRARAKLYVELNHAHYDTVLMNRDSGVVQVWASRYVATIGLLGNGLTLRSTAVAKITGVPTGRTGTPVPKGNAFGWYKNKEHGKDSVLIRLYR